jgi:hypothetical protein
VAASALVDALLSNEDVDAVEAFARASVPTSAAALGRSIKSADAVIAAIEATNWQLLRTATSLGGEWASQAGGIAERLRAAIVADELTTSLPMALSEATAAATSLIDRKLATERKIDKTEIVDVSPPGGDDRSKPGPERVEFHLGAPAARQAARSRLQELLAALDQLDYLEVSWRKRT